MVRRFRGEKAVYSDFEQVVLLNSIPIQRGSSILSNWLLSSRQGLVLTSMRNKLTSLSTIKSYPKSSKQKLREFLSSLSLTLCREMEIFSFIGISIFDSNYASVHSK